MDTERALKQFNEMKKYLEDVRLAAEEWDEPWKCLISTILSARTRDEVTIPVATELFDEYDTVEELAETDLKEVRRIIKPINFYKNKSRYIIKCANELVDEYNGEPPHDFDKLIKLTGVGRKTANVFLSEMGYDAVGVDTHVFYISRYLGWTAGEKPKDVEKDLENLFPKKYWKIINQILVRFGKTYTSRKEKDKLLDKIKKIK